MKQKNNRLLAWLLTLIVIVSVLPVNLLAEDAYADAGQDMEGTILFEQGELSNAAGQKESVLLQDEIDAPAESQVPHESQTTEEGQIPQENQSSGDSQVPQENPITEESRMPEEGQNAGIVSEDVPETSAEGLVSLDAEGILWEDAPEAEEETSATIQKLETVEQIYINPLYRDVISEEDLVQVHYAKRLLGPETTVSENESAEYLSEEEAVEQWREMFAQRNEQFGFFVNTEKEFETKEERSAFALSIAKKAMEHTGNPRQGDYIKWNYAGMKYGYQTLLIGEETKYKYIFTVTYYTSLKQEEELDTVVEQLKTELGLTDSAKRDYQKIKAIYDYLCTKVVYDNKNLNNNDYTLKYTAYAALINKTAVCQGYASAFYRLALEAGIDTRLIDGKGNKVNHGWNIVCLDSLYYNLDATWDAGKPPYKYFLKCDANFGNHIRDEEKNTDSFYAKYPMAVSDYDAQGLCEETGHSMVVDPQVPPTCTDEGKAAGSHCSVCGKVFVEQKVIPAKGHSYGEWTVTEAATCTETGEEKCVCAECGDEKTRTLPAKGHSYGEWAVTKAATCTKSGEESRICTVCKKNKETREIPAKGHTFSAWSTTSEATVFAAETQKRSCSVCRTSEVRTVGSPLDRTISVTASSLKMKKGQKTTAFKVTFAKGDRVDSWKSSNTKLVRVSGKSNGTCTITAKNVTGKKPVTLTVTLASGLSKKIKITVQKNKVTAASIKLESKKISVKKGKTFRLKPIVSPITCQEKVTYQSKNKKIATVSKKGVVKGIKKGRTTITVKAGKKSVTCTVTVK